MRSKSGITERQYARQNLTIGGSGFILAVKSSTEARCKEVPMTTLVRWDPLREAAAMHTELSRLMNGLFEGPGRQTQAWVPTLDVWETEDSVVYAFDLP